MSEEEIFNKIKDMIADNFDVDKDKITENTNFMDDLDADSIDLVEFILQLEDEFGAEIPDDEAEKKLKQLVMLFHILSLIKDNFLKKSRVVICIRPALCLYLENK